MSGMSTQEENDYINRFHPSQRAEVSRHLSEQRRKRSELDTHAHQMAERLRAAGHSEAADLIDPTTR